VAQTRHMAEHLFNIENYEDAYKVYVKLMETYPKDYLLKYQAGRCLFELELYDEALPLFEKAVQKNVVKANRFLGDIYFYQYRFEDAAEAYSAYIASLDIEQDSLINIYKQKIAKK
jgi:tetratricopeptide (TPR) repeat protein